MIKIKTGKPKFQPSINFKNESIFCGGKQTNKNEEKKHIILAFCQFTYIIVENAETAEILYNQIINYLEKQIPNSASIKRQFLPFNKKQKTQFFCNNSEIMSGNDLEQMVDAIIKIIAKNNLNNYSSNMLFCMCEFGGKTKVKKLIGNISKNISVRFNAINSIPLVVSAIFETEIENITIFLTMTSSLHLNELQYLYINHNCTSLNHEIHQNNTKKFPNFAMKSIGNFTDYFYRYNYII